MTDPPSPLRGSTRSRTRTAFATAALRATGRLSRSLRMGSGSTIGGRIGILVSPDLLAALGRGRMVALVTGTNGKTTTTRLLVEALGGPDEVASSGPGANLPAGLVSALAAAPALAPAVLEVDERYLAEAADALAPAVVVLLNLSRDQLDRMSEVRMVAEHWRRALANRPTTVVANADDPLVVYAARAADRVIWVGVGGRWHDDANHCPVCDAQITFAPVPDGESSEWHCRCGFARPALEAWLDGDDLVLADGRRLAVRPAVPGRFNQANAAMAAIAATVVGVPADAALAAAALVTEIAGRFRLVRVGEVEARLLLAKNPAGWAELIGLLEGDDTPVVVGINSRLADGRDPSWLWDVPFENLAGRTVVATGDRRLDLAVRLRHAGVDHLVEPDQRRAITLAGPGRVDYVGNYTAFQALRRRLGVGSAPRGGVRPPMLAAPAPPLAVSPSRSGRRDPTGTLSVIVVHPDLLGTYGDVGNGRVLADRARWRGLPAELVLARSDEPMPRSGDGYCLGGGEDGPQVRSAERLGDGALADAVDRGAAVLAVCAGFQIIGRSFPAAGGRHDGIGLIDVVTEHTGERRAVGEVVTAALANPDWPIAPGMLTGFENHQARTRLGTGVQPLGRVITGIGNGFDAADGAVCGRVVATYLHGPVLARNPLLADLLLSLMTGAELAPLDDEEEAALRVERLRAARGRRLWPALAARH